MNTSIIADIIKIIQDASPLPTLTDRAAVKAFVTRVAPDLVDLVFDAGGFQGFAAKLADESLEKIGDGTWIKLFIEKLPQIIQIAMTILALLPKNPTPTPAT
jgi:hypothetical protein